MMFYNFTIKIWLPMYELEAPHVSSFNYPHIFVSHSDLHIIKKNIQKIKTYNKKGVSKWNQLYIT
jgi:hypothetical protein